MSQSEWNPQPASGEWNSAANWSPAELPVSKAVFNSSSQTAITFSADHSASVESIEFSESATAYTFNFGPGKVPGLIITGQGVSNSSRCQQSFIVAATSSGHDNPQLLFTNNATAGTDDIYYCAGPIREQGYGGGVISFCDHARAGSARFKVWTGAEPPPQYRKENIPSTVGGEISFSDASSADRATFTIYGSLGIDGDTFANVVFHDTATAGKATFTNVGGTVAGGDGGNTQFYGSSSADHGVYNNWGATHEKANGGDVAFDSTSTGGEGYFYNYAAEMAGAYGGVTSFNNNPPYMDASQGASAGYGCYFNYGARQGEQGGGGHLEFSAKYGSPTGAEATIVNYGSAIANKSSAGHTIFSINLPSKYSPTAGNATIWNHPGSGEQGAAGYTEFSVYSNQNDSDSTCENFPTAGSATIFNLGGCTSGAAGGYTVFSGQSTAGSASLIAYGGTNGGYGGRIVFYDQSVGGSAKVCLFDDAELNIAYHTGDLTIGSLEMTGGVIVTQLGSQMPALSIAGALYVNSTQVSFHLDKLKNGGFAFNTPYTLLTCSELCHMTAERFRANSIDGVEPSFAIVGNTLQVTFVQ
ncbi:hypothetical protein SAMN03080615_02678 [Amphritea atlantica]|uniref:Uncharacterized protein n=1 Tax=Amphritea atlantica TaxID=355243 RepID=A0A1H9IP73_9GAMM|nr:hypothetical protein [Amphritea atlantica]SEQ76302.1 hypothetical protein SAMN03080615_02678 [Amphritea atlantica]